MTHRVNMLMIGYVYLWWHIDILNNSEPNRKGVFAVPRMIALVCFYIFCSAAYAELPAAPLNTSAAQEIANEFHDCCLDDYRDDLKKVPRMPLALGEEESFLYAKYMGKAFKNSGYSLDKTLLSYFKSQRTVPVVVFMTKLNLESFAIQLKRDAVGRAFLKASAASEATINYAKNISPDTPISEPDYIIEAHSSYSINFPESMRVSRENFRYIGSVRRGSGFWKGWIYLESDGGLPEEQGLALVNYEDPDVTAEERGIWESLIGLRIKIEGVQLIGMDSGIGVHYGVRVVDKKYRTLIKSI
uniref:hypothetical protein n=1 Tax=Pseudomonas sp. RW407 TaxID=2202894 RepID=UPI0011B4388C|nr:hypothetical protein [Pseudomonas sp. RW407]